MVVKLAFKPMTRELPENHRMAYVGGDLNDHLVPTHLHRQGCQPLDQVAQHSKKLGKKEAKEQERLPTFVIFYYVSQMKGKVSSYSSVRKRHEKKSTIISVSLPLLWLINV